MKKIFLIFSFILFFIGGSFFTQARIRSLDRLIVNQYEREFYPDNQEILLIHDNFDDIELSTFDFSSPSVANSASNYNYDSHTVVSTKTYGETLLESLFTSSVWHEAENSLSPVDTFTNDRHLKFTIVLNNGMNDFSVSGHVPFLSIDQYTVSPKARGYRVRVGV